MPQERANRVGIKYNLKHDNEYPVSLPALHHANCPCNISRAEWISRWPINNDGIYNAKNIVDNRLLADQTYISNRVMMCRANCNMPCSSSVEYLHKIFAGNPNQRFGINGYAFATIIIDSAVTTYEQTRFRNLTEVIWFLNLYGCYINGKYTAFPWTNKEISYMNLWNGVRKRIVDEGLAHGSKVDEAIIVLTDATHERWNTLRNMYEQLLSTLHYNNPKTLNKNYLALYEAALKEFIKLEDREPDECLANQHRVLRA